MTKKPSLWTGALVGLLLTAPLLAIIYLGWRSAGLPFLPSDFFNPVRDLTPGDIIVGSIQQMVDIILALNLGRVDEVAKVAETLMATGMVLVVGVVSGAVFFAIFRQIEQTMLRLGGVIGGLIVGVPMALISYFLGLTMTIEPRIIGALWLIGLFVLWGLAYAWVYERLTTASEAATTDGMATASAHGINRRQFLVTVGAASATVTVVGAGLGALLRPREETAVETASLTQASTTASSSVDYASLPNADDPVEPAPGTRPEVTPVEDHYRIDIATIPPTIDEAGWTLPFMSGLGGMLAEFTLDDLKAYEPTEAYITMSCISNRIGGTLISTTKWTGVSMQQVLADVPLPENATHLRITAADGFDETVALDLINSDDRIMLAYYWEDKPLAIDHGFPLRIHIPDHYGMKQPKWITGIEVLDSDADGYWVRRGWDKEARVRATSVIDTVATDMMIVEGDQHLIPVGGIAWAGARGISQVQVSVDGSEWQDAQIRTPISDRTWVIWRYDSPFVEGNHTFEVRCFESDGTPQIAEEMGVRPSGATGIDMESVMV